MKPNMNLKWMCLMIVFNFPELETATEHSFTQLPEPPVREWNTHQVRRAGMKRNKI